MRLRASSLKLPEFSQPLVTRGSGISLQENPSQCDPDKDVCLPLHAVHSRPWRDQGENTCDDIDQHVWRIILVSARAPKLVQTRPTDHERRINLEPIASKRWVLEILFELFEIAFESDVGKIGHHVRDNLEAGVLGEMKGFGYGADRVSTVGIPRDVLIHGLYPDLEAGTAVPKHLTAMGKAQTPSFESVGGLA